MTLQLHSSSGDLTLISLLPCERSVLSGEKSTGRPATGGLLPHVWGQLGYAYTHMFSRNFLDFIDVASSVNVRVDLRGPAIVAVA